MKRMGKAQVAKVIIASVLILGIIGGVRFFLEPPGYDLGMPYVFHSLLSNLFF